jgi:thiamine biosynthesis lipoprotein ApbE
MPHTPWIAAGLACAVLLCPCCGPLVASEDFSFYHENVLGTALELCVRADTLANASRAESRVLAEFDRLAAIFSGYDVGSEFSRWQTAPKGPVPISAELYDVLKAAEYWRTRSRSAFDPNVEVMSRLWSQGAQVGRLPTSLEIDAARALLNPPAYRLLAPQHIVERVSDCPLSLNGIAKGYIVEHACKAALDGSADDTGVLLNLGGDLRAQGDVPRTVGIAAASADSESSEPLLYITVQDRSVATSGSTQRGFRINGIWYSHVIDPRSGRPVDRVRSATVVARRGADADVLAKVCSVLEPDESLRLIESLADVECLIQMSDGELKKSAGWNRLERPRPIELASALALGSPTPGASADASVDAEPKELARPAWNREFELVVNFEINRPEAEKGRYRRPYVAVWVEDEKGVSVRTLALWVSMGGSGPFQWLPDLKRWYKTDLDRRVAEKKDIFFTVSRPTRPPGKYRTIWDGKDNHGKQLAGGEYTITVEAAREHGTYQSIRKQVLLADEPFLEDLKGNVEIRSASIEYRRKAAPK